MSGSVDVFDNGYIRLRRIHVPSNPTLFVELHERLGLKRIVLGPFDKVVSLETARELKEALEAALAAAVT